MRRVMTWVGVCLLAGAVLALFYSGFYLIPRALVERGSGATALSQKDLLAAQSDVRAVAIQALAGLAVIAGTVLTARAALATIRQTREGQMTDRFAAAVDHLAAGESIKRLGGIQELARVARQSNLDHWPAIEILSAYLRTNYSAAHGAETMEEDAAPEVRAIATVLRERDSSREDKERGQLLDLFKVDLRKAHLEQADLRGANLVECDLRGAFLDGADLGGAHLDGADLRGAVVKGVCLKGAGLIGANAQGVVFEDVDLREASLLDLDLRGGADLRGARCDEEISLVQRDESTLGPS
ncbi:MAG TPA: pentapeptide repeat-containing protein [Solirubrobacterales bacterium]|nr:pentapeptide repeat-containing protein [Solirubrobacterales bacterium]